jgi:hypothetical protein
MADANVRAEDVFPVHSRVSWGAVFAGAVVALVLYFLLSMLGAALGLSVSDRVRADSIAAGAAIWAILATVVSLFIGGWITSQCAVGETKSEAVVYGVILWGVLFAMLLWFMASGVRMGFNAMMGVAAVQDNNGRAVATVNTPQLEQAGKRAGLTPEQVESVRLAMNDPQAGIAQVADDPEARRIATQAAWWAFIGTLLSMVAAVGGALVGAGPTPILVVPGFAVRSTRVRVETPPNIH